MFTVVRLAQRRWSVDSAALLADYFAFDRQRLQRRQYGKAFGGLAVVTLLGGLAGKLPLGQAEIAAALLLLPALALWVMEGYRWHRLRQRLDHLRAEMSDVRKS